MSRRADGTLGTMRSDLDGGALCSTCQRGLAIDSGVMSAVVGDALAST